MEFLHMKIGQYCDDQKQAEKQEGIRDAAGNYFPISHSSLSHGSASYSNHQRPCVERTFDIDHVAVEDAPGTIRSYHGGAAVGSSTGTIIREVEVIEYLTRTSTSTTHDGVDHYQSCKVHDGGGGGGSSGGKSWSTMEEREHMFEKVETPSDVGKLNRLVIPKQHAERYFPLIANEKGLLLNFEDRNGKPWRFRYSYWNSSQSYVITKGWSRFVKEKQLDAGDVVSFQQGAGESGKGRLYIDWRRHRLHHPPPPDHHHHHHVLHVHHPTASSPALSCIPSSARFYLQPVPNYNSMYMPIIGPYNNNDDDNDSKTKQRESCSSGGGINQNYSDINFRPLASPNHQIGDVLQPQPTVIVNSSVPVVHDSNAAAAAAAPKRLRLFGVNMDCSSISTRQESRGQLALPSVPYVNSSRPSGLFPLRQSSMLYDGAPLILPSTPQPAEFPAKGQHASLSLI